MAAVEVEKLVKDEEELECLGGDQEGIMNFSDFLLAELTWIDLGFFIYLQHSVIYQDDLLVGHVYFACFRHRSNCIPIKGVTPGSSEFNRGLNVKFQGKGKFVVEHVK